MQIINQRREVVPIDSIQPHPQNARRHDKQVIAESIQANGFFGHLIVQESTRYILAGSGRWQQLCDLGASDVPVVFVDVDEVTARRILLADNRTSDKGGYYDDLLLAVMEHLHETESCLAGTGYTTDDYMALMKKLDLSERQANKPKKPPVVVAGPYRIILDQNKWDEWHESLIAKLGTRNKKAVGAELRKMLGM